MDLEDIVTVANGLMFAGSMASMYATYKMLKPGKGNNVIAIFPMNNLISNKDKPGKLHSNSIMKSLEKLSKNKKVKGIIFEINSGGGAVYQSKEIAEYVRTKIKVPKVAWTRDICASGAYMIACATGHIIGREESAIGSIGVISAHIAGGGLLGKLGIEYDIIKAGKNKDSHLPFDKLKPKHKKIMQEQTNYIYKLFIEYVAENRKKAGVNIESIKKIATGDAYYGNESLKYGLIDEFGSMDEAVSYVETIGNFKHSSFLYVNDPSSPFSKMGNKLGISIANGILDELKMSAIEEIKMMY